MTALSEEIVFKNSLKVKRAAMVVFSAGNKNNAPTIKYQFCYDLILTGKTFCLGCEPLNDEAKFGELYMVVRLFTVC